VAIDRRLNELEKQPTPIVSATVFNFALFDFFWRTRPDIQELIHPNPSAP
jgi:hypothetical protein